MPAVDEKRLSSLPTIRLAHGSHKSFDEGACVNTPAWLRLAGLTVHADALASLPELTSLAQVPSIRGPIEAARIDGAAARAAARAAAWAAAGAKLAPTKKELQQSAVALVERMIAARDEAV